MQAKVLCHLPTRFNFDIGGYGAPCHERKWQDGKLYYRYAVGAYMYDHREPPTTITPDLARWESFWQAVDTASVWQWQREYDNPGINNGTQWGLELKHAGRKVKTSGSNAFPGNKGYKYTRHSSFGQFIHALKQLTGIKSIR